MFTSAVLVLHSDALKHVDDNQTLSDICFPDPSNLQQLWYASVFSRQSTDSSCSVLSVSEDHSFKAGESKDFIFSPSLFLYWGWGCFILGFLHGLISILFSM